MRRHMQELPPPERVPLLEEEKREPIEFDKDVPKVRKRLRRRIRATTMIAFLLVFAVLVVGSLGGDGGFFAQKLSTIAAKVVEMDFWKLLSTGHPQGEDAGETPNILDGFLIPGKENERGDDNSNESVDTSAPPQNSAPNLTIETLYRFDYSAVPGGEIPILPMDLSLASYGASYIYNSTGLTPDTEALLKSDLKKSPPVEYLSTFSPKVLILHTHGTESYSKDGAISYADNGEELARSDDPEETVVAVGATLAKALEEKGISTVHCTIMHDQAQYKDSYVRAEETIKEYLKNYPSIRLVIDLHRDSVVKSTGELVRPVTLVDGEAAAQIMCVVGSDWSGEANPNWEGNLALALKVREALNLRYENLCRPAYLRPTTYNQELAPYSLLLEMGASGNSLQEAKRSALAVAEVLALILPEL